MLLHQIVSGNDLLQGVGGKRVDAGQVGDDDALLLFQLTLFLFHGDTRPVTHTLVGAGQRVK